jgi:hypothetical protein
MTTTLQVNLTNAITLMARSIGVRQAKDMLHIAETPELLEGSIDSQNAQIFPAGACATAIVSVCTHLNKHGFDFEQVLELVRGFDDRQTRWTTLSKQLVILEDLVGPHHSPIALSYSERTELETAFRTLRAAL